MLRNKRGVTLIELMVAVLITVLVILSSLLCFIQLMILADASINLTKAANDAQFVLEQLKNEPYSFICSYTVPDKIKLPNGTEVSIFENLPEESVTISSCSVSGDLTTVYVDVSWKEKNHAEKIHYVLPTCILK